MRNTFAPPLPSGSKSLYVLAVLVAAAAVWAYLTPIDVSVRARGIVRPEGELIRVVSETAGRIRKVHASEGASVRAGDPLLQLDTRDLSLKKRALESRIHFIELRLADLQRQISDVTSIDEQTTTLDLQDRDTARRAARSNLENARLRFARSDLLVQEGLIARQLHDESRAALAQAEADESRLSSNSLEVKRSQSAVRLRDLAATATPFRAELAALYHDLEQTGLDLTRLTITSPTDGQITSFAPLHAGEVLASGAPIATLVPRSHSLVIESWLPAAERMYVAPGGRVRLKSDTLPSDQYNAFDGIILSISPDARFNESLSGAYRVLISPLPYSPALRLGLTYETHFITRQERLLWLLFDKLRPDFD